MIKKSLIWSYRVAYIALGTFVFLGLLSIIGLRYFILPHIDDYKPKIVQSLSQILGQKVTIGNIYANWDNLNPHISVFDVDIYDKENRIALNLRHIEGSLSWTSIPLLEPRLASFSIHQPELTIRREKDGTIYVAGVSMSGPSKPEFPNWLLRQGQVNVIDANIIWQDDLRGAPALNLDKLNLALENPAWDSLRGHHNFSLRAIPSAATSKPIDIRGRVFGKDVSQIESWHGSVYAKAEGTDIAAWRNWLDYPLDLREGHGAAQFWVDFADSQVKSFTTDVALDNVVTRLPYSDVENSFNRIAGRLKWMRQKDGQKIQGEGIKVVTSDNLNMRSGKFSIRQRNVNQQEWLEGNILLDEIQLETLDKLSPYFTLPSQIEATLKQTKPVGRLSNLELTWKSKGNTLPQYAVHADFSGLGMSPYKTLSIPGFRNLTGKLDADQDLGKLTLNTQAATINFEDVLRWPIPADELTGQIKWKHKHKTVDIEVKDLAIKNPHLMAAFNGQISSDGTSHFVDLSGSASHIDLKNARFYYPIRPIGKDTITWLDKSILSGNAENVNFKMKGNLNDYPFADNKKGLFKLTGDVKDLALDYTEGWPKIEGVKLDLLFEGKRMELRASGGHFFGAEIKNTKLTIPDLIVDNTSLDITGEVQGPVAEVIKFINNSPIEKMANGFTKNLKTSGSSKLSLALHIPLMNSSATKVKGSYAIENGSMLADSIPEITKINGVADFTESSVNANNINSWIYGAPAQFSVATDKNKVIQIAANGHLTDTGLRKAFANLVPNSISGGADWSAKAQVSNNQSEVTIRSNLVGLSSNLPVPFAKKSQEAMPLLIEKKPSSETQDTVKFTLGNNINAKFVRISQNGLTTIDRGDIGINIEPQLPNQKGLSLHAKFEELDLDDWLDQFDKSTGNAQTNSIAIDSIDLSVGRFDVLDHRINSLKLNARASDNTWIMNVRSNEINGDMKWVRDGNGKMIANLSSLTIPGLKPDATKANDGAAKQLDFKYPGLDITADNFEIGKKKLGRLELQAQEQAGNWSIDKLKLINPDGVINANGEWRNWKRNPNTKLRFDWQINDIGKALNRLNYGDIVKGGTAEVTGQLRWPGSPHEFDIANLSGSLHLDAKKGQILQVEPGVGRLFSVLSLQNLPRRLTLDFKDLFSSGFTFDKINADVNIERGIMYSDNFKMDGPTAKVEIKGETDINKETQHLYVKAKPYISDTLSLAAFAGGPAVGAAAYIAQKILKDPLNKIAETQYEIVGTWSDPQEKESKAAPASNSPQPLGR